MLPQVQQSHAKHYELRQKVRDGITMHEDGGVPLDLTHERIGVESATQVARALEANTALTKLDLGYNSIGAEGVTQVARALEANTSLTQLNLESSIQRTQEKFGGGSSGLFTICVL